ncbi:hypothetical protein GOP47_0014136 [Adiantum capillus-veneris]|uniref:Pentatricopeptide repeat-containing protein n=1 Tax=Adiantum capillus-veneris TaxID=13818 RepID=A0A9D4UQ55_ADICA|nr:hypothetical protein GOP47_0014136 [Adiantum capillus-veneris]
MGLEKRVTNAHHNTQPTSHDTSLASNGYLQRLPPPATLVTLIRACAKQNDLPKGHTLHAYVLKNGLISANIFIGNTLLSMYAKCGALARARQVFDELSIKSVVSWTALIDGYAQHRLGREALKCFKEMKCHGLSPDGQTFACTLKACGNIGDLEEGERIHEEMSERNLLETNVVLCNAVVDMYAKCGEFVKAQQVLEKLPFRSEICWNGLIAGYLQHGQGERALDCLDRMQHEGLSPTAVTFACALKACGSTIAIERGEELHGEIMRRELLGKNSVVGTALVDMYIKCGALAKAQKVFDVLPARNVVSWTALIAGYAEEGRHDHIFGSFNRMVSENVKPNLVTYVIVLNACRRLGLVNEAQSYFESMSTSHGILPTFKHRICMVSLFGFAGYLDKAMSVIKRSPLPDRLPAWSALISTCQKLGNVKLAREAFEHAVQLHEEIELL